MIKLNQVKFLLNILSSTTGIRFIPHDSWAVDLHNRAMFYIEAPYYSEIDLGYIIHEAAHLRFTSDISEDLEPVREFLKEKNKSFDDFMNIINYFEDIRVEEKISDIYPGASEFLEYKNNFDFYNLFEAFKKIKESGKEIPKLMQLMYGLLASEYGEKYKYGMKFFISEDVSYDIRNLVSNNLLGRLGRILDKKKSTIRDILADLIYPSTFSRVFFEYLSDVKEGDGEGEGGKDSLDSRAKKEQDKIDFCQMMDKMNKELDGGREEPENKKEKQNKKTDEELKEELKQKQENGEIKESQIGKIPQASEEDLKKAESEMNFLEYQKDFDKTDEDYERLKGMYYIKEEELQNFVENNISKMRKSASIIKDLECERFETGYRTGKIDERKLTKVPVGCTRIFKKKRADKLDNKDLCVLILVDESGSMNSNNKNKNACKAATLLGRSLELIGKNYGVYGFNDYWFEHKSFKDKNLQYSKMVYCDVNSYRDGSGWNNDGWAVQKATNILKKRPESNKILIVFSDGEPANSGRKDEDGVYTDIDLSKSVRDCLKFAKIYSFGIQTSSVERYYPVNKVLNNPEDLPKEMIDLFKEWAGKRIR